jgi:hypothetical protein
VWTNPARDFKAEYQTLKRELLPRITAPSTYPEDAMVPDEIKEAVERLRELEPQIVKMGVNRIFGDDGPYLPAQKIQTYYFSRQIQDDPIVVWAGGVAKKYVLQRQLEEAQPKRLKRMIESTGNKSGAPAESANSQTHPFARYLPDVDPSTFPEIHPAANIFPMLPMDEMQKLAESIKDHGIMSWITMLKRKGSKGQLLDGRNRWVASLLAGREPTRISVVDLDKEHPGVDPLTYVITHNLERRHLTIAERAVIAEKIATARSGGQKKDGEAPTVKEAAAKLGVGQRAVHEVRKLKTEAPKAYEDLTAGKHKTVHAAVKAAGVTKPKKKTTAPPTPTVRSILHPPPPPVQSLEERIIRRWYNFLFPSGGVPINKTFPTPEEQAALFDRLAVFCTQGARLVRDGKNIDQVYAAVKASSQVS